MGFMTCPICEKRTVGYLYDGTRRCYTCRPLYEG